MDDIAIRVENLSKQFEIGQAKSGDLRESFGHWLQRLKGNKNAVVNSIDKKFWALKDIDFEIKRGEAVGIIGRNGAGKSTLLKILSRITEPTSGRIEINGRVSSLLEVGTGFHPELSGRENIFLNGTILGMKSREVKGKFDEIVAFSGVEKFIDTPVKHYSSGMKVRLAFSVAAHLEPEILIVDEVLAVGDAEFQKKCLGKMDEVSKSEGKTVLFVSHNMGAVQTLCTMGLLLDKGQLVYSNLVEDVIKYYYSSTSNKDVDLKWIHRSGNGIVRISKINVYGLIGDTRTNPLPGLPLEIEVCFDNPKEIELHNIVLDLRIDNFNGVRLFWISTSLVEKKKTVNKDSITFRIEKCPLNSGAYSLSLYCVVKGDVADWIQNAFMFEVEEGAYYKSGKSIPKNQSDLFIDFEIK
jgi:lipopolysaccharide transport system ATP-binding protein